MTEQQADYGKKSKTIFRTIKNENHPFVMIDRRPVENPDLSWGAKGVLSYLLSRPDNWTVRLRDLVKRSTDGTSKIRGYIRELVKAGHVHRVANKDPKTHQIIEWVIEVYELPFIAKATPPISIGVASHQVGNRTLNKNESFNDKDVKNIKRADKPPRPPKAQDFPSNVIFREVTEKYPPKACWHLVLQSIHEIEKRLLRPVTKDDLFPFYEAWMARGFSPVNLAWLTDWAVRGMIPNREVKQSAINKTQEAIRQFLNTSQEQEIIDVYSE